MVPTNEKLAKMREKLLRKRAVVQRVLATADGQELLLILQREFLHKIDSSPRIEFSAGRADVVGYLMALNDKQDEEAT